MELVKNLDADWCEVAIGQDKGVYFSQKLHSEMLKN